MSLLYAVGLDGYLNKQPCLSNGKQGPFVMRDGSLPTLFLKRRIVRVEVLGIQPILGDAEGIGDFSASNRRGVFVDG